MSLNRRDSSKFLNNITESDHLFEIDSCTNCYERGTKRSECQCNKKISNKEWLPFVQQSKCI